MQCQPVIGYFMARGEGILHTVIWLLGVNGISTVVGYLMLNPVYIYIYIYIYIYMICKQIACR